jgi:ribosomal protein S27AE
MNNDFPTDGPDSVAEVEKRPSGVALDAIVGRRNCPACGRFMALHGMPSESGTVDVWICHNRQCLAYGNPMECDTHNTAL